MLTTEVHQPIPTAKLTQYRIRCTCGKFVSQPVGYSPSSKPKNTLHNHWEQYRRHWSDKCSNSQPVRWENQSSEQLVLFELDDR